MGILNVTPDSFADGGRYLSVDQAVERARIIEESGGDFIDIGGESSRPGAEAISVSEEIRRTVPAIQRISRTVRIPISIDTVKAEVARAALEAGASIINDISGLRADPGMMAVLQATQAGCVIMHMRGTPRTMQLLTEYDDLTGEICGFFEAVMAEAVALGIKRERFILDPGIGFSKNQDQNLGLIKHISEFRKLGRPVLMGPSRKSFIGRILNENYPTDRVWGTAGAAAVCAYAGADIIRVHDVREMKQVTAVADAVRNVAL